LVLVLVEFTDIIFAVDSIPAIFAVTSEPFLVFTANAFALLGLRAMYFLLADLMHRFIYLKIGLALVLVWVGIKMGLHDFVKVPSALSLTVILTILVTAIVASLIVSRNREATHVDPVVKQEFSEATEAEIAELKPVWHRSVRI
jgi:tellurite resistance protein TerC